MKPSSGDKLAFWVLPLLSVAIAALLCNWKGGDWGKEIRFAFYDVFLDSFPDYAPNFTDSRGLPHTYYPGQNGITPGYQYNGTLIANYALDYYERLNEPGDTLARQRFFNCVHWLDSAIAMVNGHALYLFHWRQPWYPLVDSPFTSGMTSGRAIEVLLKAFLLTGDSLWLTRAGQLVKGYDLPIEAGGFTYKEPQGWWYEEIADTGMQTPRILDGHIFALAGLYEYYHQTNDPLALQYFNNGLKALKQALPGFDRNDGKVGYDVYGKIADDNYHPLLVKQMNGLWQMTGDSTFLYYFNKWNEPLAKPYLYKIVRDRNKSGALLIMMLSTVVWILLSGLWIGYKKLFLQAGNKAGT